MFKNLFGKRGKRDSDASKDDESIRAARPGDVVVISGFAPALEDAYFVVDKRNRYEASFGKWYELIGADGDRHVAIEWSDIDGLYIAVSEQDAPVGLSALSLDDTDMTRLDEEQSIDNYVTANGQKFYYRNSYVATFFNDDAGQGGEFYLWEFTSEDGKNNVSVVKWEDAPFEVYFSAVVSPDLVSVYKR